MNSAAITKQDLIKCSLAGVLRGVCVNTLIRPFKVIKNNLQCSPIEKKSREIALELLQQEGVAGLWKGLIPELMQTSFKQIWCWPMIIGLPVKLEGSNLSAWQKETITGFSIATLDSLSAPLDKAAIIAAVQRKSQFSLKEIFKEGWSGFTTHWTKLSVSWVSFLTVQKYFRDKCSGQTKKEIPLSELAIIGVQTALVVSIVTAPFDFANTIKQAENRSVLDFINRKEFFILYRAAHLHALTLVAQAVASVILIDRCQKFFSIGK